MEFLEKDLEEIIYLSDRDKLEERGLSLNGKLKRQLRIGNYGVADLVEFTRPIYINDNVQFKGVINILELKKDKIGVSTFFQALNYLQGIKTYLQQRKIEDHYNFKITLIGKDFDNNSSFVFLGDIFNQEIYCSHLFDELKISVELFTYKYGLDGLKFTLITDYNLTKKGF
jgi:hypothetical protein